MNINEMSAMKISCINRVKYRTRKAPSSMTTIITNTPIHTLIHNRNTRNSTSSALHTYTTPTLEQTATNDIAFLLQRALQSGTEKKWTIMQSDNMININCCSTMVSILYNDDARDRICRR